MVVSNHHEEPAVLETKFGQPQFHGNLYSMISQSKNSEITSTSRQGKPAWSSDDAALEGELGAEDVYHRLFNSADSIFNDDDDFSYARSFKTGSPSVCKPKVRKDDFFEVAAGNSCCSSGGETDDTVPASNPFRRAQSKGDDGLGYGHAESVLPTRPRKAGGGKAYRRYSNLATGSRRRSFLCIDDDDIEDEISLAPSVQKQLSTFVSGLARDTQEREDYGSQMKSDQLAVLEADQLAAMEELLRHELNGVSPTCVSMTTPLDATDKEDDRISKEAVISNGPYRLESHFKLLKLAAVVRGGYIVDMSRHFLPKADRSANLVQEFCQPMSFATLRKIFTGLEGNVSQRDDTSSDGGYLSRKAEIIQSSEAAIPFRTTTIRIRPDVMCGAVMNSIRLAVVGQGGHLLKRQGGHLRAMVVNGNLSFFDAQLCVSKSDSLDRRLVLRFYYPDNEESLEVDWQDFVAPPETTSVSDSSTVPANLHLREACSLLQLNKSSNENWWTSMTNAPSLHSPFPSRRTNTPESASAYLRANYRPCPSVIKAKASNRPTTFPSLSSEDWPLLQASWTLCKEIWNGLEARFSYNTLTTIPYGQYPCLGNLDVHYCAQLETLSRERMLQALRKDVEQQNLKVDQAEEALALFTDFTKSNLQRYDLQSVESPEENLSVDSSTKHEDASDKFASAGQLVSFALGQIQPAADETPSLDANQSLRKADAVVRTIYSIFEGEHTWEQNARWGSLYVKATARLFQLRFHLTESFKSLRDSHHNSEEALVASNEVFELMKSAENYSWRYGEPLHTVPLVQLPISNGTCYITGTVVVFSTKTLFSKDKVQVIGLAGADFRPTASNSIDVYVDDEKVYSVRSADIDVMKMKQFLDVVKSLVNEM